MMGHRIRFQGIYDSETLFLLKQLGIEDFGLDFRPKALNFCPETTFLKILDDTFTTRLRYYLHFSDCSHFVIERALLEAQKKLGPNFKKENWFLEFTDVRGPEFFGQFGFPYLWAFTDFETYRALLKDPLFAGIVFDQKDLERRQQEGEMPSFMQEFKKISSKHPKKQLHLNHEWGHAPFPSLLDHLDFSHFTLAINNVVELCYRKVDPEKLRSQYSSFRARSRGLSL